MKTSYVFLILLLFTNFIFSQVGIGTTNPQAQLEVANGNVRFSSYGSGTYSSSNSVYGLAVDANGDVVEVNLSEPKVGLQFFTWDTGNNSTPNINSTKALGTTTTSGIVTGDLDDNLRDALAPDNNGYIIRIVGTLDVKNTGDFTFDARSDDGSRIYIDDVLVVENWYQQSPTTRSGTINLARGQHKIEFWYYENSGGEFMQFNWGTNPDGYTVGNLINASEFFVKY